ncbi:RNA-binding cell elongation regulator Jag/EloR [Microbacterium sp. APC 3898]|uniref:RNA-binding protein KhpB n=1 Tax=Planococcus notacanthi TaxID=3035188 RepID=A0ABT7ZJ18_9BACL|nr:MULTISPECIES: RNA-binding cell elongation regulator Jag/EloR [Terrabacteria group]MBF6634415.1 protein jag [Planococcus sp. (in: firmicutes)]MDN3427135.1 RNA-binding cell elongation regulator Jag/EloR [Planococcus sp. APC 4016]MDN3436455.1 RNA-binding cell elongation regulator Jag/EloR [Planococcus sp. APC 3900]MDN3499414.1 RNA-binding cell elongation regulator Jag/EloR [Microbacterium sp. APC 3898]
MKQITQTGLTVENAISEALEKLQVTREEVSIKIIQEQKKGFFGFGAKKAEVEVTVIEKMPISEKSLDETSEKLEEIQGKPELLPEKEEEEEAIPVLSNEQAIQETKNYIQSIAEGMKIEDLSITHEQRGKKVNFYLESEKVAMLIGKRGQTLNSLQQLAQLVANKYSNQFMMVELDAENYRERRQETLEQLADRMADKAIRTGGRVQFEPMPSYERKVIHQALSRRLDIDTHSEGKDPNRYLVIEPHK